MKYPMKTADREKVSMWFDRDVMAWLRAYQEKTGVPIVEFVRRAVAAAIAQAKKR